MKNHIKLFILSTSRYWAIALFSISLIACSSTTSSNFDSDADLSVKPDGGGSVEVNGNGFTSTANPGFTFSHWVIYGKNDTTVSQSRILKASADTLRNVEASFNRMDLMPLNFTADADEKVLYFIDSHFVRKSGSTFSEEYYSIFKYYPDSGYKERIWSTKDRLEYLDLSPDGTYLAFTRYDTDVDYDFSYKKEVLHLADKSIKYLGLGLAATWSNTQPYLFTGSDESLFIANPAIRGQLEMLPASVLGDINITDSYEYAAWSPDDRFIIFNRLTDKTLLFERKKSNVITINENLGNYHWLSNDQFLAVSNGQLLKYSLNNINNPEQLGVKVSSYARMDLSPDKKWIAHLKKDENLYLSSLDGSESRLLVEESTQIDPGFPVWLSSEMLLIHNRSGNLFLYDLEQDQLTQI